MYKIRAKQGFNVIINDIDIKLRSNSIGWTEVDEELFDNSKDAKKLANLIIKDDGSSKTAAKTNKASNVVEVQEDVFVIKGNGFTNPKDIFVTEPEVSEENTSEVESTEVVETKIQESLNENDAPIIVANVPEVIENKEAAIVREEKIEKANDKIEKGNRKKKK